MKNAPSIEDSNGYTSEQRQEMLAKMSRVCATYYGLAVQTGVHAFIEFCGLQTEFLKVCEEAEKTGITEWPMANTHNEVLLPFKPYHAQYLAEKLNCIYGPALLADPKVREAFIAELFGGEYQLVPAQVPVAPPVAVPTPKRRIVQTVSVAGRTIGRAARKAG